MPDKYGFFSVPTARDVLLATRRVLGAVGTKLGVFERVGRGGAGGRGGSDSGDNPDGNEPFCPCNNCPPGTVIPDADPDTGCCEGHIRYTFTNPIKTATPQALEAEYIGGGVYLSDVFTIEDIAGSFRWKVTISVTGLSVAKLVASDGSDAVICIEYWREGWDCHCHNQLTIKKPHGLWSGIPRSDLNCTICFAPPEEELSTPCGDESLPRFFTVDWSCAGFSSWTNATTGYATCDTQTACPGAVLLDTDTLGLPFSGSPTAFVECAWRGSLKATDGVSANCCPLVFTLYKQGNPTLTCNGETADWVVMIQQPSGGFETSLILTWEYVPDENGFDPATGGTFLPVGAYCATNTFQGQPTNDPPCTSLVVQSPLGGGSPLGALSSGACADVCDVTEDEPPDPNNGGCCIEGECFDYFTQSMCNDFGGEWFADGCGDCEKVRACCTASVCIDLTEYACDELGGSWVESSKCEFRPCQEGACCRATTGGCEMVPANECTGADYFAGGGIDCSTSPCASVGACCHNNNNGVNCSADCVCELMSNGDCDSLNVSGTSSYAGDGTYCGGAGAVDCDCRGLNCDFL